MNIRTDLAVEAHELSLGEAAEIDGVVLTKSEHGQVCKTVVDVTNENGAKTLGKLCGRYITIDAPSLKYSLDDYELVCEMVADELREMLNGAKNTLVCGLGNSDITPDALGTEAVNQLIVTRHMKQYMPDALDENYGNLSAVCPGVMGTTGIETVDIVKGVTETVKPDAVIAIDALAGADMSRVCSTVQIADTGIAPGSGVGNHRNGLNRESLGVPVIAVGVPTVIAAELISGAELSDEFASVMVTTKDIDRVIRKMSKTIANGINMAVHKDLTLREIEEIIG